MDGSAELRGESVRGGGAGAHGIRSGSDGAILLALRDHRRGVLAGCDFMGLCDRSGEAGPLGATSLGSTSPRAMIGHKWITQERLLELLAETGELLF
jgi:hypothetical protein